MKRTHPLETRTAIVIAILVGFLIGPLLEPVVTHAATNLADQREREIGRQKLTPTVSTALTIPSGTWHAQFYIEGGDVFYRWDGGVVADTAGAGPTWNASKWPAGLVFKEENDKDKLSGLRLLCASCTVWVSYSRARGNTDPVP